MRICDLALYSPETSSGVRTYIENKIRYMSTRSEVKTHVVIVPGSEDRIVMQNRTKVITVRGIPSFYPGISLAINVAKIADIVEKEVPDLIEVNCQYTLPWAAFLASHRRAIPVIGVYHTDVPACAGHMASPFGQPFAQIVEKLADFYVGLVYRHFTLTIVLNEGVIHRLNRLGVHRIQQLPCGVDMEIFSPDRVDYDFRRRLSILPDQKILLYVGRLSPEKEIDLLLRAHSKLAGDRFVLLIAGDGPDAKTIETYASSHADVIYLGHFDKSHELAAVYASSDVFVIPSRHETFGMAALEALACGLPVVAISESGTAGIVRPEVGMLAKAGDVNDIACKILMVAERPREKIQTVCRDFAAGAYSWNSVFDEYFDIYRKLIGPGLPTIGYS